MGEYEPNDSRNVTGANNKQSQNEGGNSNQTGQHWQSTDASISQSKQQGHGQDPGMRSQAPSQQQGSQSGGGQSGSNQSGSNQSGMSQGGSGQQQQFQRDGSGQMGGSGGQMTGGQSGGQSGGGAVQFEADPQLASELNQQARPGGGQRGGQEAHDRASGQSGIASQIREHMDVIGADGVHVGTVDHVDGHRIKLTKKDSGAGYEGGQHTGHHHYLSIGLVAGIEGNTVRLSANGDVAYGLEEEEGDGRNG